ncbi:hypothetical protein HZA86_05235 [Candidatus Uhrbacteria bacterium]|nr:hypothetical protein [Candidatus Uhrbacteria bacterium]
MLSAALVVFILLVPLTFAYGAWRAAPWVPSLRSTVDRFLPLAHIHPGQTVVDLGCGDGKLLAAVVAQGGIAIGFEIALLPYLIAKIRGRILPEAQRQRYFVYYKDFWSADLSSADVVFAYLLPRVHQRLRKKLETSLKPGTRVIISTWPIIGWRPSVIDTRPGQIKLYSYQR